MIYPNRLTWIKSFCADHYLAYPDHRNFVYEFFELLIPLERLIHTEPERFIRLIGQYVKGLLPRENNSTVAPDFRVYKNLIIEIYPGFHKSDLHALCCHCAAIPKRRNILYNVCDLVFEYFY